MSQHVKARRGLVAAVVGGLVATPLAVGFTSAPASANPAGTGLVISEVYGGGGSASGTYKQDYVELYNPTNAAISVSGMSLQYRSSTGTSANVGLLPNKVVPANDRFLVVMSTGTGIGDVPTPDHTLASGINMSGTAGQVFLVSNTTGVVAQSGNFAGGAIDPDVVDMVGFGTGTNSFETVAAPAPSTTTSISRTPQPGTDTDNNSTNFASGSPSPTAATGSTQPGTPLAATNPGAQTATVGTAYSLQLASTGGTGAKTWAAPTLPAGLTITSAGLVSGTPTTAGSTSVTATVTDSATPTANQASTTFTITVNPAAPTIRPIAEIQGIAAQQGANAASPLTGQTVTTEGVVTGVFTGTTASNGGIYVQTGGTGGASDATPGASDAIYVFGGNAQPAGVAVGDSVRVTGPVSEFGNLTQITPAAGGVTELAEALPAVIPAAIAYPASAADREAHESELLAPTDTFTVTNAFSITNGGNAFAEIGLATGSTPLKQPTEFTVATDTAGIAAIVAENAARAVVLDDGFSGNYAATSASNTAPSTPRFSGEPLPWISGNANPPRVGGPAVFTGPVVLDYRNDAWKFQPTQRVTDNGAGTATFGTDRAQNMAPAAVGGDLKIATFNVLNYFPTTGQAHVTAGGVCRSGNPQRPSPSFYEDRQGNPIANDSCTPDGPRGAATQASFERQQAKIVDAINKLDASVVSLEELENSIKMIGQTNRDAAIATLVAALNAASAPGTWAFAPSPAAAAMPTPAEEDVIRTGFIYKPADVQLSGASMILRDEVNFDNAREPLAQAFRPVGAPVSATFGVIVNHFKSKGSACAGDTGTPVQGNCNADRVGQAQALVDFADDFRTARSIDSLFLVGDFNSYTQEDPMRVLYDAGYENITSDDASDASYSFSGLTGSIDHVLGNEAAVATVTGSDIWEINANESLAYQYSRYNYHGEIYFDGASPWSSSDHNPEIVGISTAGAPADPVDVQILATNDFHGRIANDTGGTPAGAGRLAGAVKQFRAANPATSFVAAGDLIGASTFESFIARDKPTIDALNSAGLDVSAVGNHEFDQGYDDLVNRVMAPYDATTNPYGGAQWKYLGANVKFKDSGNPALEGTWIKDQGGIKVGYVGAVTEHLDELVSPGGIANIEATDIVAATNTAADELKAAGADVVVLLVHEGAASASCASITADTTSDFGKITAGVNANVDAIVSGHTHLAYDCSLPVAAWAGRPVTERPVVSAGQYGSNLNKINFTVDPTTRAVTAKAQTLVPLKTGQTSTFPIDGPTQAIVDAAVANAEVLGAEVVGQIGGPFFRAKLADGTTENRGGESTLSNLVAEIQRAQTSAPNRGAAQIAFMNPGGLRADLAGSGTGAARDVTFKQAANVQPFANTLVNMDLTGAQIKSALEQQWQPAGASRPFLKLGISKGFSYTYDPSAAAGSRIRTMTLNGTAISPTATYSVTVNSFLATGGDNFGALNGTARKQDTGVTDLQAQVDYFDAQTGPVAVDYSQRAVGVKFPAGAPTSYVAGTTVTFDLSSLSMTGPGDAADATVQVALDGQALGSFPVTTTRQTALPGFDEVGTATIAVTLPVTTAAGTRNLVITGPTTNTRADVPVTVTAAPPVDVQILATNDFHGRIANDPSGTPAGAAVLAGAIKQFKAANPATSFVAAGDLIGASTFESFIANDKPTIDVLNEAGLDVSAVGNHEFDQGYDDLTDRVMAPYDATTNPDGGAEWQYLGANVKFKGTNNPALEGSWIKDQGGIKVGYVGAVTEHLDELVSPAGIANIEATDIVAATNTAADELKAEGADVVVLLVHEGAPSASCATITADTTSDFGKITAGVNANVDAIVSGHTHLAYDCSLPVTAWADRPVKERPVVSAGQYGSNLNQIVFKVDPATGAVQTKTQALLPLKTGQSANYPVDQPTKAIVDAAVANAEVLGAEVVGQIGGPFNRAKLADGTTENRGGESTLSNLVAEIQRAQTSAPNRGGAQIAFMNPGGLRADLVGSGTGAARDVTFKQAANVQPFANTLVNMDLTGAQIKSALEQQWQPAGASRPFLKLGISKGFGYTYDPSAAAGSRIRTMTLNGTAISPTATYSVTVNSFLAAGGDNFGALNGTARKQDTGVTDLQAQVDYFDAQPGPVPVDYSQRAVGVKFPAGAPTSYRAGAPVTFDVSSFSMTGPGDVRDTAVQVSLGGQDLGTFPVTTTVLTALPGYDEAGTASVTALIPPGTAPGETTILLTGAATGTIARVPVTVAPRFATTVTGTAAGVDVGQAATVSVTVDATDSDLVPTGTVTLLDGTEVIGTVVLANGTGSITVPASALEVGSNAFTLSYGGDGAFAPSTGTVTVTVAKSASQVTATSAPFVFGQSGSVEVTVGPAIGATKPTGGVALFYGANAIGAGSLSDGAATITFAPQFLAPGTYPVEVRYSGDGNYAASTGNVTVTVTKAASQVTATSAPFAYGQAGSVAVEVGPALGDTRPTGTVTLTNGATTVGTATLSNGTASIAVAARSLAPGTYEMAIAYAGDANYAAASGTVTVTVTKAEALVGAAATPERITVRKDRTTITVAVRAAGYVPSGSITLRANGSVIGTGTLDAGGNTRIAVGPMPSTGVITVQASYSGDANTVARTATTTISVVKQVPLIAIGAPAQVAKNARPTVTVTLKGTGAVVTGQVRFTYNGTTVTRTLNADGKASVQLPKLTRNTTVTVAYPGNALFTAVSKSATIRVK